MFGTIMIALVLTSSIAAFVFGPRLIPERTNQLGEPIEDTGTKLLIKGAAAGFGFLLGVVPLIFSVITIVDDGKVGVTRAFGEYGAETREPGINLILPWETVQQIDTRVKSYTFSDDGDGESVSGPISAQADGGGNLRIEHTVQLQVDKPTADNLLREVGGNWFDVVVLPAIRSCTRDATTSLTLEEAYTTRRTEIGTNTFECVSSKVNPYGITLVDVLIRDVDPGEAVRTAIDSKQQQEQELQRAAIELEQERINAQKEAVRAFGISNAEQIVSCGGQEVFDEEGKVVNVIANETCEDQFNANYLQWLYINQLDKIDGVVILPPEFDGQLFVQTPQN